MLLQVHQFSHSVRSESATPWTATCQASLSITNSQSRSMDHSILSSTRRQLCKSDGSPQGLLLLGRKKIKHRGSRKPKVLPFQSQAWWKWGKRLDGSQAEQLESVPCGQILQYEDNSKREEKLSPVQIRDHVFLILEVKEAFPTVHAQKSSLEVVKSIYPLS